MAFGSVAALIWGGYLAASRHAIGAGLDAADLAFLRYVTAGVLLTPWLVRNSWRSLAGVGWRRATTLAMLAGPLFVLAGASGYHFAPLAHGAVIQLGMLTLMAVVLACVLTGERAGSSRIVGLAIVVSGLVVTAGPSAMSGGSNAWIGDLLFALAGSMWALFTVLQRRWGIRPIAATAAVSVLSGFVYGPIYLAQHGMSAFGRTSGTMVLEQVAVQGVLSGVVALFAFGRAVQLLGAGRAALFPALAPGVAILLGVPLSGELPTRLQCLGLLIVSIGLMLAARSPNPQSTPKQEGAIDER